MARLVITVEGHSEEAFVTQLLLPHLAERGIYCFASRVEFSRNKGEIHRGGLLDWDKADGDIRRWLKTHKTDDVRFTTMFDLYALPDNAPGRSCAATQVDPFAKVHCLEAAISESICDRRFLPYIQLHEFEALVLAGAARLADFYPQHRSEAQRLAEMVNTFKTPEHINEGRETAPSKRIIREIPKYEGGKRVVSPMVLERIGLETLRQACPHFGAWLTCLESIGTPSQEKWPTLVSMPES